MEVATPSLATALIFILSLVGLAAIYFATITMEPLRIDVASIDESLVGRLVKVDGEVLKVSTTGSGNVLWSFGDGDVNITVAIFDNDLKSLGISKGELVEVTGLVSEYKGELEIEPKGIVRIEDPGGG